MTGAAWVPGDPIYEIPNDQAIFGIAQLHSGSSTAGPHPIDSAQWPDPRVGDDLDRDEP